MLSAPTQLRHALAHRAREASLRWPRRPWPAAPLSCWARPWSRGTSMRTGRAKHLYVGRAGSTGRALVMLSAPTQLRHALAHRAREASLRCPDGLDRPRLSAQTLPGRGRDPSPGRFARDCPSPVARLRV